MQFPVFLLLNTAGEWVVAGRGLVSVCAPLSLDC